MRTTIRTSEELTLACRSSFQAKNGVGKSQRFIPVMG